MTPMTGTYRRKRLPATLPLQIQGVSSRGGTEYTHPPLEEARAPSPVYQAPFIPHPHELYRSHDDTSSRYSPTEENSELQEYTLASADWNNDTSSGQTTERSSTTTSTLSDDDFDKEASAKVRVMFDRIDSCLFESEPAGSKALKSEYDDWTVTFPHHRVLGVQVGGQEDLGYQCVESNSPRPTTGSKLEDVTDQDLAASDTGIMVEGKRMVPHFLSGDHAHLWEEIFAVDGEYEDTIAIDTDINEDALDSKRLLMHHRRRRARYPPITPNACAKDDISNALFDVLWSRVTNMTRTVLQNYAEASTGTASAEDGGITTGSAGSGGATHAGGPSDPEASEQSSRLPQIISMPSSRTDVHGALGSGISASQLGLGGVSSMATWGTSAVHPRPLGNFFQGLTKQHSSLGLKVAQQSQGGGLGSMLAQGQGQGPAAGLAGQQSMMMMPTSHSLKLDNILKISKKEMQTREPTFIEDSGINTPPIPKKGVSHRHSSATFKGKVPSGAANGKPGRLAPLNDAARTPNVEDDFVRGRSLLKRHGSPPVNGGKSLPLPPITYADPMNPVPTAGGKAHQKLHAHRASSAVADENMRVVPRDKTGLLGAETRPSTTHTIYWGDGQQEKNKSQWILTGSSLGNPADPGATHHAEEKYHADYSSNWGPQQAAAHMNYNQEQAPGSAAYTRRKTLRQPIS